MYESENMSAIRTQDQPFGTTIKAAKRRTYQTSNDVKNQQQIAQAIANATDTKALSMQDYSEIDYAAVGQNGQTSFWFEIKQRYNTLGAYDTLFLSLHKWQALYKQFRKTDKSAFFFARFSDGKIYFINVNKAPKDTGYSICMGGRAYRLTKDGGRSIDPEDIEPVIHIPTNHMTPLEAFTSNNNPNLSCIKPSSHALYKSENLQWASNAKLHGAVKDSTIGILERRALERPKKQIRHEQTIAALAANTVGAKTQALKSHAKIDYALVMPSLSPIRRRHNEPDIVGWLEAKPCNLAAHQCKFIDIPIEKWNALYEQRALNKQKAYVCIQFADDATRFIEVLAALDKSGFAHVTSASQGAESIGIAQPYAPSAGGSIRIPMTFMKDISELQHNWDSQ